MNEWLTDDDEWVSLWDTWICDLLHWKSLWSIQEQFLLVESLKSFTLLSRWILYSQTVVVAEVAVKRVFLHTSLTYCNNEFKRNQECYYRQTRTPGIIMQATLGL